MTQTTNDGLIAPHGGTLNPREVSGSNSQALVEKATGLPKRVL